MKSTAAKLTPLLVLLLAVVFFTLKPDSGNHVIVRDQESGSVFYEDTLADGSTFDLTWIHSIELEPWRETYRIDDGKIFLTDVYLKSYGAGAPTELEGTTTIEDGIIHTSHIDREIPQLNWIHSHATQHSLEINGTIISREIPHHTFAELVID